MEQRNEETKRNFTDRYASGLKASVHNNSIAYGFSIMITAALAVLSAGTTHGARAAPYSVKLQRLCGCVTRTTK